MLLSRVAESLYWAGRYLERAEDTARIVREHTDADRRPADVVSPVTWEPLLAITGSREALRRAATTGPTRRRSCASSWPTRATRAASLRASSTARENLRTTPGGAAPRGVAGRSTTSTCTSPSHRHDGVGRRSRGRVPRARRRPSRQRIDGILSLDHEPRRGLRVPRASARSLERADMTTRVLGVRAAALMARPRDGGRRQHAEVQWMSVLRVALGAADVPPQHPRAGRTALRSCGSCSPIAPSPARSPPAWPGGRRAGGAAARRGGPPGRAGGRGRAQPGRPHRDRRQDPRRRHGRPAARRSPRCTASSPSPTSGSRRRADLAVSSMDPLLASALFGYPTSASRFDEAVDEAGVRPPGLAQPRGHAGPPGWGGGRAAPAAGRPADRGAGRQLPVPRRRRRRARRGGSTRSRSSSRPRTGSRWRRGSRSGPACSTPSSPTSTAIAGLLEGVVPPEAVLGSELVPVARPDQPAAAAAAPGRLRGRPRAHQRRRVAGAAGPDRRPVGRGLRPPQPHRPGPALPRRAPRPRRPPPQRVLLRPALRARRPGSGGPAGQPHGRPHVRPRPPQLLRALLPGRTARLQPGRRRRPDGPPRSGLAALARRPGAGRRAAPPDRRRRRRPPRARRRQRQGRARAAPRLPPRHHRAGQRARAPARPASWRCSRSSAGPARPCSASRSACPRWRRGGAATPTSAPRWWTASTRWCCTSPVRTASPARSSSTTWASAERDALLARLRATPSRFVAQEKVDFATTPMLRDGAVVPGHDRPAGCTPSSTAPR